MPKSKLPKVISYDCDSKSKSALEKYEEVWNNIPLFYTNGHFNTTTIMLFPDYVDTINLEASHLSPNFQNNIASAIQRFRIHKPNMEGFAVVHEIQLHKNDDGSLQIYVSDNCNGIVMFFRHRELREIKVRAAFARLGNDNFILYAPNEIIVPNEGIVAALSFDLNYLQQ